MRALFTLKAYVEVDVGAMSGSSCTAFLCAISLDSSKLDCAPTYINIAAYVKAANSVSTFSAFPLSTHADSRDSTEPNVP